MNTLFIRLIFSLLFLVTATAIPGTELVKQEHSPTNENQTNNMLPAVSCRKNSGKKHSYSTKKTRSKGSNPEKYTKQKNEANEILKNSSGNLSLTQLQEIYKRMNKLEL